MKAPVRQSAEAPESDCQPGAPHPRLALHLFGQGGAERTLLDAYRSGRFPHAWILGGRRGIGKATLAWRLARFLLAHPDPASEAVRQAETLAVSPESAAFRQVAALSAPDLVVLRREWNEKARPPRHFTEIRVEDVRAATARFRLSASDGGWRVAIIDSGDDLNASAANALLKMIEEPPPRSLFLIVSSQPGKLLPTIRSRCRRLMLEPLSSEDLSRALAALGQSEHARDQKLLQQAGGSVAEALRLADREKSRFVNQVERLLQSARDPDWGEIAALADRFARITAERDYAVFVETVFRHLDSEVRRRAKEGAGLVAPLAGVWERFAAAQLQTDELNLDKRPLVLSLFENLEAAARARSSG